MPEVAGLNLSIDSSKVAQATAELRALAPAATAAERAAERWGMTTREAGRSADDFSKRVQGTIRSLEFERQQLTRTAAEQAKYAALRRAGVSASSAEGQAIAASVAALQAQRTAAKAAAEAHTGASLATKAGAVAATQLRSAIAPLAAAFAAVALAQRVWSAGMKTGDLGEQAEQIGVTTDELQAFRYAANQAGIETAAMDGALTKLQKAMGAAADGGKEQVELFAKLGVKLLDAQGELRPVADVLPEVARGVLGIGSSSQRTATLMELFGKSGAKMATVLEEIAKGSDVAVAAAQKAGAIASGDVIKAWDDLGDALIRAGATADVTIAKLGAPIATVALTEVEKVLGRINGVMDQINSKEGFWQSILKESRAQGSMGGLKLATPEELAQLKREALDRELANQWNPASRQFTQDKIDRLNQAESAAQFAQLAGIQSAGAPSVYASRFLPAGGRSTGAGSPTAKGGGGGSDPYKTAMESSRDYIAMKNAETAAIGMSAEAAARLKHETELLNKASNDNKVLSAAQTESLKAQAAAMAEADAKFASAKFMDDAITKSNEFIAAQQIEQDTLFMSTEAAMAYRIEHEAINQARAQGITLQAADIEKLREGAAAQAAAAEKTRQMTELFTLAKDVVGGFFTDFTQGLREGQSILESFGNAALNVLNKITDKLISMAIDDLVGKAFGGSKGGGGGGILNFLGGLLGFGGSGGGGTGVGTGTGYTYANGAAFAGGNVIPFARGGVVGRPTLFPMANGMGLMGEAGPEAVMPLRRGPGGRLGVEASGAGGGGVVVNIHNYAKGTKASAKQSKGPGGEMQIDVIVAMVEGKMASRMSNGQGSLGRVIEGKYGLQAVGR